ncbi:hypothetical protein M0802_014092 [Mischocyttarus mexicanus]|nr:hypothetical protein M0802_014092 [Mischocyttarus mexicanus]
MWDHAVKIFTQNIIDAIRSTTPLLDYKTGHDYPAYILNKIVEKRKLRRKWHNSRSPEDKRKLNKATRVLRKILQNFKNEGFQYCLRNMAPTADSNYSLWKATRRLTHTTQGTPPMRKPQGEWARTPIDKVNLFASSYYNCLYEAD